MSRNRVLVLAPLMLAALSLGAVAAPAGLLSLERWVVGGGGGHASGAHFTLVGTVGQGVVGFASGGVYEICSGFWCGAARYGVFLPLILRG
jgi:hypothetical protein